MSDDKRIEIRPVEGNADDEPDEIELEVEGEEDVESVLREALEAVERSERSEGTARGEVRAENGGESEETGVRQVASGIAPAAPIAAEETSAAEIEQLQDELADLRDRSIRTLADFDNYRKRIERERREERRYSGFEVVHELLEVLDNLERAVAAQGSAEDLKTGVEMILRQTRELLRRHGVAGLEAEGRVFDPAIHEAVSRREDPEVEVPTVDEVLQAGYTMHERLLRPARVTVSMPAADSEAPDEGEADEPAG